MPKHVTHIKNKFGKELLPSVLLLFLVFSAWNEAEAQVFDQFKFGVRADVDMSTLTHIDDAGLELGFTAGVGAKYNFSENINVLSEILYTTGGKNSSRMIDAVGVKVKIYDKIHLHYLAIPVVYQYYFTDILGLEVGPQFGFCLGGKRKMKTGNEDWSSVKLTSNDYNIFDFGILTGIYTNNLTSENDFIVSLRAYFGFTDVMKDEGKNKNVCIQLGIAYIIGK